MEIPCRDVFCYTGLRAGAPAARLVGARVRASAVGAKPVGRESLEPPALGLTPSPTGSSETRSTLLAGLRPGPVGGESLEPPALGLTSSPACSSETRSTLLAGLRPEPVGRESLEPPAPGLTPSPAGSSETRSTLLAGLRPEPVGGESLEPAALGIDSVTSLARQRLAPPCSTILVGPSTRWYESPREYPGGARVPARARQLEGAGFGAGTSARGMADGVQPNILHLR